MAKDVKVQIVGDASKYKAALADAGSASDKFVGKTKRAGEEMSKFGLGALAVGGAIGVGLFKAGEAASDLGESINAVRVTFGKSADGILKLGEDAATAVGLSNTAFNGLAVQFSSFASTIAGKGGNVVSTMQAMTGRAADFASVMNIDVAEAARLFQSGLAGETEPLKKFGIDLSAAAVTAYAAANGIGEVGKQLTESEKVTARYGLLMESTAKTQGDFANTADSAANATRIAKAEFTNAAAALGEVVAPIMAEVASKAAMLAKGFVGLNEASGGALVGFTALVGGGAILLGTVTSIIGRVQKMQAVLRDVNTGELTTTGKLMQGLVPVAAVAAVAFFGLSQRANHAADALKHITENAEELSSVADKDVLNVLNLSLAQGIANGVSLADTMKTLAQTNLEGAKRALEMAVANGTNQKVVDALRQAIVDEDAAAKQGAATIEKFGDKTDETGLATEGLTGFIDKVIVGIKDEQKAADDLKSGMDNLTKAIIDERQAQLDANQAAIDAVGTTGDLEQSIRDVASGYYDLTLKIVENDKTQASSKFTDGEKEQSQRDLETAIHDHAGEVFALAEQYAKENGAVDGSKKQHDLMLDALKLNKAQYPELAGEIQKYIDKLNAIPGAVFTEVNIHSTSVGKKVALAEGGVVKASPGGTSVTIGEGGHDEAVIPLDGNHGLPGGGGTHIENLTIQMPVGSNGNDIVRTLEKWRGRNGNAPWMSGSAGISGGTP